MLFSAREHLASPWLDLAEGRLRLDRLSRNGVGSTFFPWALTRGQPWGPRFAHSSRGKKACPREGGGLSAAILRCARGPPAGASSIASGLPIAIEAAVVAGSKTARRSDMANIGSFKKSGNEFQGEIVTLSVQTKNVRIVPETNRANDNAPSHRVYVGRAEIGAAWSKRSNEGRDYLSVKLDDPELQRADLRQPLRRRGRRGLHPHLVARPQAQRRLSRTRQRPARPPGGAFSRIATGASDMRPHSPTVRHRAQAPSLPGQTRVG